MPLSLYFVFYNFCRVHKTVDVTPAMATGVIESVMKMTGVVGLIDAKAAETPMVRGSYKKRLMKFQTETLRAFRKDSSSKSKGPWAENVWRLGRFAARIDARQGVFLNAASARATKTSGLPDLKPPAL